MAEIPKFQLYGRDDPQIEEKIQPRLALRAWADLNDKEKKIALQELKNRGFLSERSHEVFQSIAHINTQFLRECPGKLLHGIHPGSYMRDEDTAYKRLEAAFLDFQNIFLNHKSEALVFRMLTRFAQSYIDYAYLERAEREKEEQKRGKHIADAFEKFDHLANCLNHIFEQFSVNVLLTRSGLIPKQDQKITEDIYVPTLISLADPKWKNVNSDLVKMFEDYRNRNYSEVITKAHSAIQRFLQILVGEEGKSGKGEIGKLFGKAKEKGIIPVDRFTEPLISVFQSFIASERATNSTAKPALKNTTSSDALLMMNVVMVFLQHCLQNIK